MAKHFRIFLIFSILLFSLFSFKFYIESQELSNVKQMIAEDETKSLTALFKSFRQVYQKKFLENHIVIDDKTVELLPVRTTQKISDRFAQLIGDRVTIRTVSDRPRNHNNKANSYEMNIIDYFNSNKDKKSYFEAKGDGEYYYAEPLYIESTCLKCHGKKEDAVDIIQKRYDTAFDYKLGELRGIISIDIAKKDVTQKLDQNFMINIQVGIFVFVLFMLAVYLLIKIIIKNEEKYAKTLEDRVQEQFTELKDKNDMLFQQSKMAAMGEMIGNIAHQWRQPLSSISTAASGMKVQKEFGTLSDEDFEESIDNIVDATQHLSGTIDDFRNFFHSSKDQTDFSLTQIIDNSLKLVQSTFKSHDLEVIKDINEEIMLYGYDRELTQAILNILNNAEDVLEQNNKDERKIIQISVKKDSEFAIIEIIDNAKGIPENIIDRIFEPYFTTKGKDKGTGIGLYMTRQIVIEHMAGNLTVKNDNFMIDNTQYNGAKFSIYLPLEKIE